MRRTTLLTPFFFPLMLELPSGIASSFKSATKATVPPFLLPQKFGKRGKKERESSEQKKPPTLAKGTICANVDVYDAETAPGAILIRSLCPRCERASPVDVFGAAGFSIQGSCKRTNTTCNQCGHEVVINADSLLYPLNLRPRFSLIPNYFYPARGAA